MAGDRARAARPRPRGVITSYSIHYTKLYELGLALNNALAHDRLQRLAALDPLTGLFNRRFGLARLREEFGRSQRSGSPVGLVMFDIEGETQIRSYRVTLHVSGTLDRVTPTLTSDPPLSSLQILALLAGQDESEVANLTQTQARASQAQLV